MADRNSVGKIVIAVPAGCSRKTLKMNALDSRTRELALKTTIRVGDQLILCDSFHVMEDGNLCLDVRPKSFEIVQNRE